MEEALLARCQNGSSVSCGILRPGNIYGPEYLAPRAKGVIGAFVRELTNDGHVTLVADGQSLRDFVHADDVVRAIFFALDMPTSVVWNVGTGVGTRVRDVLELVCHHLGRKPTSIKVLPARATDPHEIVLDCEKIFQDTGWTHDIDLDSGLYSLLSPLAGKDKPPPVARTSGDTEPLKAEVDCV